jgi:hypothetical protein
MGFLVAGYKSSILMGQSCRSTRKMLAVWFLVFDCSRTELDHKTQGGSVDGVTRFAFD